MWPEQWVRVVVDPLDDPRLSDDLERRADILGGTAVVRPVPGATTPGRFAVDLLVAMGKHHEALEWEGQAHRSWQLAVVWLRAETLRHLVVLDADRLEPSLCRVLAQLAAELRFTLWLVVRNRADPSPLQLFGLWREWTIAELLCRLPCPRPALEGEPVGDEVRLPDDGFLTFRASCRERFLPTRFAAVDALYREAFQAAQEWNREMPHRDRAAAIAQQLRTLTVISTSATETRIRLCATQAAHFLEGTLIRLRSVSRPGPVDVPHVGLSRSLALRLRRIATPAWACGLTLIAAAAFHPDRLAVLRMRSLSVDGRQVVVNDERHDVPAHAAALVRAQLLVRQAAGGRRADYLFVDEDGRPYPSGRHLVDGLEQANERGAVWWTGSRRWPLQEDYPTTGYSVDLHRLTASRSPAARVRRTVDLMTPNPSVCTELCGRRQATPPCGVSTPSAAETVGLVHRHRRRLRLDPRVEFSLCLSDDLPSRREAPHERRSASECCTVAGRFGSAAELQPYLAY